MAAHIFIPGKISIDQLAVELNAETWELREEYSTGKDSISIDKPLAGFKAKTKSILHQWLFDAPAEADIELNNGLIYSKKGGGIFRNYWKNIFNTVCTILSFHMALHFETIFLFQTLPNVIKLRNASILAFVPRYTGDWNSCRRDF